VRGPETHGGRQGGGRPPPTDAGEGRFRAGAGGALPARRRSHGRPTKAKQGRRQTGKQRRKTGRKRGPDRPKTARWPAPQDRPPHEGRTQPASNGRSRPQRAKRQTEPSQRRTRRQARSRTSKHREQSTQRRTDQQPNRNAATRRQRRRKRPKHATRGRHHRENQQHATKQPQPQQTRRKRSKGRANQPGHRNRPGQTTTASPANPRRPKAHGRQQSRGRGGRRGRGPRRFSFSFWFPFFARRDAEGNRKKSRNAEFFACLLSALRARFRASPPRLRRSVPFRVVPFRVVPFRNGLGRAPGRPLSLESPWNPSLESFPGISSQSAITLGRQWKASGAPTQVGARSFLDPGPSQSPEAERRPVGCLRQPCGQES